MAARLCAGNDPVENNSSVMQQPVDCSEHCLGGGERGWAPVHKRQRQEAVSPSCRREAGLWDRGPCAGGGPDVHSVWLSWTLAGR